MAFPISPINGQNTTINGITYTYDSSKNSWTRVQAVLPTMSINVDTFVSNGSTVQYTLGATPGSKELVSVNIDGVLQQKTAYSISSNVLTLTGTPLNGAVIEVKTIVSSVSSVLTGLVFDTFTGTGSQVDFILGTTPTSRNFTLVTINGVTQQKTSYIVSGSTLSFTNAPANSTVIEVITFGPAISSMIAAGSSSQIQYNNNGTLTGASSLSFDATSNTLSTTNLTLSGNSTVAGNLVVAGNIAGNISLNSSVKVANGLYSTNDYTGTFTDGIVVDYVTGTGRISVGTNDGISFYNNGVASNAIFSIGTTGNATVTGALSVASGANILGNTATGNLSVSGNLSVVGAMTLQQTFEVLNVVSSPTGTVVYDFTTGGTFYHAAPSSAWVVNLTNLPTTANRIMVAVFIINQGATGYAPSAYQVNGSAVTVKWLNATSPSASSNKIDIISLSCMYTGGSWIVMGQSSNYS